MSRYRGLVRLWVDNGLVRLAGTDILVYLNYHAFGKLWCVWPAERNQCLCCSAAGRRLTSSGLLADDQLVTKLEIVYK